MKIYILCLVGLFGCSAGIHPITDRLDTDGGLENDAMLTPDEIVIDQDFGSDQDAGIDLGHLTIDLDAGNDAGMEMADAGPDLSSPPDLGTDTSIDPPDAGEVDAWVPTIDGWYHFEYGSTPCGVDPAGATIFIHGDHFCENPHDGIGMSCDWDLMRIWFSDGTEGFQGMPPGSTDTVILGSIHLISGGGQLQSQLDDRNLSGVDYCIRSVVLTRIADPFL